MGLAWICSDSWPGLFAGVEFVWKTGSETRKDSAEMKKPAAMKKPVEMMAVVLNSTGFYNLASKRQWQCPESLIDICLSRYHPWKLLRKTWRLEVILPNAT